MWFSMLAVLKIVGNLKRNPVFSYYDLKSYTSCPCRCLVLFWHDMFSKIPLKQQQHIKMEGSS